MTEARIDAAGHTLDELSAKVSDLRVRLDAAAARAAVASISHSTAALNDDARDLQARLASLVRTYLFTALTHTPTIHFRSSNLLRTPRQDGPAAIIV